MKFSAAAVSLIIATTRINVAASQTLPPVSFCYWVSRIITSLKSAKSTIHCHSLQGWTDLGSGSCVDSSDKEFEKAIATPYDSGCPAAPTLTKEGCAELCQCFMTHYGGLSAMKGAYFGIDGPGNYDCACYHDSTFDCANTIQYPVFCETGTGGNGSIAKTGPKASRYVSQDCLKFGSAAATPTSAPTAAPVTSAPVVPAPPSAAPVTSQTLPPVSFCYWVSRIITSLKSAKSTIHCHSLQGWTDLGSGSCVDSSDKEFEKAIATPYDSGCPAAPTLTKEGCAELCQCFMTHYGGLSAMKGAYFGIDGPGNYDCACYHDSTFDCANTIQYPVFCETGTGGNGSIAKTGPKASRYVSQDCLKFGSAAATPTSAPTAAPVTSAPVVPAPPSAAPVTASPSVAPVTTSPSAAPVTASPSVAPVTKMPVTMAPQTDLPTVGQGGNPGCPNSFCSSKADCVVNGCDSSYHCLDNKCAKLNSKTSKGTKATKGPSAKSTKSSKLF